MNLCRYPHFCRLPRLSRASKKALLARGPLSRALTLLDSALPPRPARKPFRIRTSAVARQTFQLSTRPPKPLGTLHRLCTQGGSPHEFASSNASRNLRHRSVRSERLARSYGSTGSSCRACAAGDARGAGHTWSPGRSCSSCFGCFACLASHALHAYTTRHAGDSRNAGYARCTNSSCRTRGPRSSVRLRRRLAQPPLHERLHRPPSHAGLFRSACPI